MVETVTPLTATDREVTLRREDYQRLLANQTDDGLPADEAPSSLSDETGYRVIDGEVYEIMHDSWNNPYLKRRGVLVNHE